MWKPEIFLGSSALMAGIVSEWGAERALLLGEAGHIFLNVSRRSGLRMGTPGDALAWIRDQLGQGPH